MGGSFDVFFETSCKATSEGFHGESLVICNLGYLCSSSLIGDLDSKYILVPLDNRRISTSSDTWIENSLSLSEGLSHTGTGLFHVIHKISRNIFFSR